MSASDAKTLLHSCKQSTDKRYKILGSLLKTRNLVYDSFLQVFKSKCDEVYKGQDESQLNHTLRRLSDFFCGEIEQVIFLNLEDSDRAIFLSLGRHFRKQGNTFLSEYYFGKNYQMVSETHTIPDLLHAIPNLISLNYLKSSAEGYKMGLALNEELNTINELNYHTLKVDYFNNISNLYLDTNTLGNKTSLDVLGEIEHFFKEVKKPELRIGLRISQMRLSFGTPAFSVYSQKVESIFRKLDLTTEVEIILRKYLFLKLVLGFYSGGNLDELIETAERIRTINNKSSFVDSYTVFYLVVLLLLKGEISQAQKVLKAEPNCFKQHTAYLKDFIDGFDSLIGLEFGKAKRRFNHIVDSEDYYMDQFSRLCLLCIYHKQGENETFFSMLRSTERKLKANPGKVLINSSTMYFVASLKAISQNKKPEKVIPENVSCMHRFLLNYI